MLALARAADLPVVAPAWRATVWVLSRVVELAPLATAVLLSLGCGSDDGVGLRLLSTAVRAGEPPKVAVEILVTADCFFSVLLNGNLRASGRWAGGSHEVLIPGYLLRPRDNAVRIDVAGEDGSSARLEEPLTFCETGALACGDYEPDAGPDPFDGGLPDAGEPDAGGSLHRYLCAPCDGDRSCGGLPNECVFLYPNEGVCGTYCGDDFACPRGFYCTQVQDATHTSLLCFPPGPDYSCY